MNEKQNDTKKRQIDQRWLLIKHEKCKAMFTLDMEVFVNSFNLDEHRSRKVNCPNCNGVVLYTKHTDRIVQLFDAYQYIGSKEGFLIKEINPKDLKLVPSAPI